MSVYIPGMEMPHRCFACPMCIKEDGEWLCSISHGSYLEYMEIPEDIAIDTRPDWCPLVELPPHGRLIDESTIDLSKYEKAAHDALHNGKGSILYDSGVLAGARAITQLIRRAPTIIPASEEAKE